MSDKVYPYIGSHNYSSCVVCFSSDSSGVVTVEGGSVLNKINKYHDTFDEQQFKNITREYLANTWGVVESPEHAEFLIELFTSNNISIANAKSAKECKSFYILHGDAFFSQAEKLNLPHLKQITIPMPPKSEPVLDWPCVGDDVLVENLEHDNRFVDFVGHVVEVVGINQGIYTFKHENLGFGALKHPNVWAKKPKTPEQELEEDIKSLIDDAQGLDSSILASALMAKYNITKKQP